MLHSGAFTLFKPNFFKTLHSCLLVNHLWCKISVGIYGEIFGILDILSDTNMEKEANKKEKEWWAGKGSLGSLDIDEERLPLILARDVKFNNFITRVEKIKARRYFDYRNGTVTIIELPTGEHETTQANFNIQFMNAFNNVIPQDGVAGWGAKSLFTNLPTNEYEEPDACFVPRRLLTQNPALNPCDRNGNPWPTIILEVCSSESLAHIRRKINDYWLAPNRCADVIVIKIGSWHTRCRNSNTRRPLRRLQCLKFCRAATLQQNPNATTFNAIEEIEFGSVFANGRESYFCTGPHMKWLTISCDCIYTGCPQPPQLPNLFSVISSVPFRPPQFPYPLVNSGVAIDLFDLQQLIFEVMGPN